MAAITKALGKGKQNEDEEVDVEDSIVDEIKRNGKQENVSFFAFTATPKPTTLQLFGRINKDGHGEAFHTYSMKQAIEEGFILDVLQNYITYKTFYQVNKAIQDDPTLETKKAKRQIARTAELHDTNIAQRVEVIVEHFRTTVMQELDGNAKAMVIMKNETLKKSAASNNEKDFAFPFYDNIDDALIEGLDQNESFFSLLLNNDDIKKQVLGIFMGEIYKSLKKKAKETDVAGRIYKIPTQKNEFSEMPIAASEKQKNR